METKICNKCGTEKPTNGFYKRKASKDEIRNICKACELIQFKEWKKKRPERWKELKNANRRRKREKTSIEVLRYFGDRCACLPCGFDDFNKKVFGDRFLQLDHIYGRSINRQKSNWEERLEAIKKNNLWKNPYRVLCKGCNNCMEPGEWICELHKYQIENGQIEWPVFLPHWLEKEFA